MPSYNERKGEGQDNWDMSPCLFPSSGCGPKFLCHSSNFLGSAPKKAPLCSILSDISACPASIKPLSPLQLCRKHKVGILYCRAGQSSEEEMYNNEEAGPAFEEFLSLLGEKVCLKGFTKYAAQLDVKSK